MVAQRIRLNTIAMNMANIDTVETPEGGPYQRRSVVFSEGRDRDGGEGVHVSEINKEDVYRWEYDPQNPYANEDGFVKMPGIDSFTRNGQCHGSHPCLRSEPYRYRVEQRDVEQRIEDIGLRFNKVRRRSRRRIIAGCPDFALRKRRPEPEAIRW